MQNRRAQILTPDLLIAVFAFLSLFVVFTAFWFSAQTRIASLEREGNAGFYASMVANQLLTPGTPANWSNPSDAVLLGISNAPGSIDGKKLQKLMNELATNYESTKEKLGIYGYELKITVLDSELKPLWEAGKKAGNASFVSLRYGVLNGELAILKVEVSR